MPDDASKTTDATDVTLKVNTDVMRDVAADGFAKAKQLEAELQTMFTAMNNTSTFWDGEAASLYREVFANELKLFANSFAHYRAYANELVSYADHYEGVDSTAQDLADNIDQGIWADV